MKARSFNSQMHFSNEEWAAYVLNMQVNPQAGPDLIDKDKIAEVKFCLVHPGEYRYIQWKALEYQMQYPEKYQRPGFWILGEYALQTQIKSIRKLGLEDLATFRQIWIVNWDWMKQFPPFPQKGKTEISKWENTLRYGKKPLLPRTITTYEVQNGLVHITEGIPSGVFTINQS